MGRNILAVIVGYLAMFILVAGGLTAAYMLMGADKAFQLGTYEVTTTWIVTMLLVGIVAAVLGGILCAKISKHSKGAVMSLMILVLVLGGLSALGVLMAEKPIGEDAIRASETPSMEAMMNAQQPLWTAIANPIIGVVGVMIGATLVCPGSRKCSPQSGDE